MIAAAMMAADTVATVMIVAGTPPIKIFVTAAMTVDSDAVVFVPMDAADAKLRINSDF